jgi:hypothetical protein
MRDDADQASVAVLSMIPVMVTVRKTSLAAKEICLIPRC